MCPETNYYLEVGWAESGRYYQASLKAGHARKTIINFFRIVDLIREVRDYVRANTNASYADIIVKLLVEAETVMLSINPAVHSSINSTLHGHFLDISHRNMAVMISGKVLAHE